MPFSYHQPRLYKGATSAPADPIFYLFYFNILCTTSVIGITGKFNYIFRTCVFLPLLYSVYWGVYLPLYGSGDDAWFQEQGIHGRSVLMVMLQALRSIGILYITLRRGPRSHNGKDDSQATPRPEIPAWMKYTINFLSIFLFQSVQLLMAFPTVCTLFQPNIPLTTYDYVLTLLSLANFAIQLAAIRQQQAYQDLLCIVYNLFIAHTNRDGEAQDEKDRQPITPVPRAWLGASMQWSLEDIKRGFITKGLWAWSREPVLLCEQLTWYLQALFPILAYTTGRPAFADSAKLDVGEQTTMAILGIAVSLVGPLMLTLNAIAVQRFAESNMKGSFPAYQAYQTRVGMFSPIDTFRKGLLLRANGRLHEVDAVVYGQEDRSEVA